MKNSFYISQILPNFSSINFTRPNVATRDLVQHDAGPTTSHWKMLPTKPVLVMLEPISEDCEGLTQQRLELLHKILASMKLNSDQYEISQDWTSTFSLETLSSSLIATPCRIIFMVGAPVAQHFLGKEIKLSQVQGKLQKYSHNNEDFHFIPLFHPDFIAINPTIKKMAWESMQKLTPDLGKLLNQL